MRGERRRKLLFLSKRAEKLLGSYENTGWMEQLSLPKKKPWTRFQTLPSAPGGPIIGITPSFHGITPSFHGITPSFHVIVFDLRHRPSYLSLLVSDASFEPLHRTLCFLPLSSVAHIPSFYHFLSLPSYTFHFPLIPLTSL